jgi:hypothetical protein
VRTAGEVRAQLIERLNMAVRILGPVASIWAEVGHRMGWVHLDRFVPAGRWDEACATLTGRIASDDLTGADVTPLWGGASFTSRDVLALVSDDGRWLFADFDVSQRDPDGGMRRCVPIEGSWLRNLRLPAARFSDRVCFSPSGRFAAPAHDAGEDMGPSRGTDGASGR